jgi:hypothetical protein
MSELHLRPAIVPVETLPIQPQRRGWPPGRQPRAPPKIRAL